MGKSDLEWTDRIPFGRLPKEERKAVTKVIHPDVLKGSFEHSTICTQEIGAMLKCFEAKDWETMECRQEIDTMYSCVDTHSRDPDPRKLVRVWQKNIRQRVFQHFVAARVMPRLK